MVWEVVVGTDVGVALHLMEVIGLLVELAGKVVGQIFLILLSNFLLQPRSGRDPVLVTVGLTDLVVELDRLGCVDLLLHLGSLQQKLDLIPIPQLHLQLRCLHVDSSRGVPYTDKGQVTTRDVAGLTVLPKLVLDRCLLVELTTVRVSLFLGPKEVPEEASFLLLVTLLLKDQPLGVVLGSIFAFHSWILEVSGI